MTSPTVQTRHEFLQALHELLKPRGYVEIGVQTGASLRLANCPALGIDPRPCLTQPLAENARVVDAKSDVFFERGDKRMIPEYVDLAFIDGMHLWDYAVRDFRNVERYANPRTVVVFDDVLPRNQQEASRVPQAGDWTGDVWKVHDVLGKNRPDLQLTLVDTQPTGLLLVRGADPSKAGWPMAFDPPLGETVPPEVLSRSYAVAPEVALAAVATW